MFEKKRMQELVESEVVGTELEKNFATNDLFLIDMTRITVW